MRSRAKALRKEPTLSERRLWNWLRNRTFAGHKFRRQVPIGPYVVDFFCAALRLAIEVDGKHHETEWIGEHDTQRSLALERRGLKSYASVMSCSDSLTVERIIESATAQRCAR